MLESFNQRKLFFKFYILCFNMLMSWSWNIFWFPFGIVRAFIQIWYVLWPPLLCNFISFYLKRWIFSRQSPRPFSRQHPFRRLRDIYRKLIRKTNQKTIPSICRTGHEICMFAWTLYYSLDQRSNKFWYCCGWMDTWSIGPWILDPTSFILLWCENILQHSCSVMMDTRSIGPWI